VVLPAITRTKKIALDLAARDTVATALVAALSEATAPAAATSVVGTPATARRESLRRAAKAPGTPTSGRGLPNVSPPSAAVGRRQSPRLAAREAAARAAATNDRGGNSPSVVITGGAAPARQTPALHLLSPSRSASARRRAPANPSGPAFTTSSPSLPRLGPSPTISAPLAAPSLSKGGDMIGEHEPDLDEFNPSLDELLSQVDSSSPLASPGRRRRPALAPVQAAVLNARPSPARPKYKLAPQSFGRGSATLASQSTTSQVESPSQLSPETIKRIRRNKALAKQTRWRKEFSASQLSASQSQLGS